MPGPPISALAPDAPSYATRLAAALAAMNTARGSDRHVEVGGGVLFNPETQQYAYTAPAGFGNDAHFGARVQFAKPWQLDSLYHTHPAAPRSTQFSQDDLDMAQRLKVPSYILSRYDNKVRMFDPSSSPIVKSPGGDFSLGTVVDEAPPTSPNAALAQALLQNRQREYAPRQVPTEGNLHGQNQPAPAPPQ